MQLAPWVPRAKALKLTGFSKVVFMFMTHCKWNKIPTPQVKALERCTELMPSEMPHHVELVPQ